MEILPGAVRQRAVGGYSVDTFLIDEYEPKLVVIESKREGCCRKIVPSYMFEGLEKQPGSRE